MTAITKRNKSVIYQFIKRKNRRNGVMIGALDNDGFIMMGWSKANVNAGDVFDSKVGMKLATQRLKAKGIVPVPDSIVDDMYRFEERCGRYFKRAKGIHKIEVQKQEQNKDRKAKQRKSLAKLVKHLEKDLNWDRNVFG